MHINDEENEEIRKESFGKSNKFPIENEQLKHKKLSQEEISYSI
jgi:hypothetical protein